MVTETTKAMFGWFIKILTIDSMRRRISTAFLSIILLLFFAGAMSLFELERVSHDTEEILMASKQNVDLAGEMISALKEQDDAMIQMAVVGESIADIQTYGAKCKESIERLQSATKRAYDRMQLTENPTSLDSLIYFTTRINGLANDFLSGNIYRTVIDARIIDSTSTFSTQMWYLDSYKPEYMHVSDQITKYMTGAQSTLGPDVNRLSHTARRAVTPVFISLAVMLVVVLMFFYFIHTYIIHPIERINRSLGDYLAYKVPFDANIPCRDELVSLRDRIIALIAKLH